MFVQTVAPAAPRRAFNVQCPPTMPPPAVRRSSSAAPCTASGVCCSCCFPLFYELELAAPTYAMPYDAMPRHDTTLASKCFFFSGCRCCQQIVQGDDDDDMIIDRGNKVSLICPLTSAMFKEPVQSKVRSALPSGSAAKRLRQHNIMPWQRCGVSFCARRSLPIHV